MVVYKLLVRSERKDWIDHLHIRFTLYTLLKNIPFHVLKTSTIYHVHKSKIEYA